MSIKAEIIKQEIVVEQVKNLLTQKESLDVQEDVLSRRLEMIKASLAENEDLRTRNKALLETVLKNFEEEWKRKAEYYPDLRQGVLLAAAALNAPPAKK